MLIALQMMLILANSAHANEAENGPIKVYVDTTRIQFAQDPLVEDGTTLVQLRPLFEALNISLGWDGEKQIVTGTKTGLTFTLPIDSSEATVNGKQVKLSKAAQVVNGHTIIPLRFVGEATGELVHWDGEYREITIMTQKTFDYYGITKEEAERLLNEPDQPKAPTFTKVAGLQGMYYSMSLDVANYCGGGFCFEYYTFLPDGKILIGEPQNGGPETIDCAALPCYEYAIEGNVLTVDNRVQFQFQQKDNGMLIIGGKDFIPVAQMNRDLRFNREYENIKTFGPSLAGAMTAKGIRFKEDGTYASDYIMIGIYTNSALEPGGYASDRSESGTYQITGNTIVFRNTAGELWRTFMIDISENGDMQHLIIGGKLFKLKG